MPKLDLDAIPQTNATGYPAPYDKEVEGRWYRRLSPAAGLTQFGVSHVVLKPGAWSSQRHWHEGEDEFAVMIEGDAVLVEDDGETQLSSGDCVGWAAGDKNGHHIVNRSDKECVFVVVGAGNRSKGGGYSDIDMIFDDNGYYRRDGSPIGTQRTP